MTMATGTSLSCDTALAAAAVLDCLDELAALAEAPGAASGIVQHPHWLLYELDSRGADATPHVVIARSPDGRIAGYAPFLLEQHTARVAFGTRQIAVYRGRVLRLLGSGVVALPHAREAVESAIAQALKSDTSATVMRIQETVLPNTFAAQLARAPGRFSSVQANLLDQLNWKIRPQGSVAAYLAALGAKRRNDLTRRLRNVYKKLGPHASLRVFDAPGQIAEYGRLMNQVYARSWHAAVQPIDWEQPARLAVFEQLAREQQVIGHVMMLDERPIAYVHGYRIGGSYLLDDTGYDEEFAALGIGSALVFQSVQDLIERHPDETIDFGYGDNQYKRLLADQQTPCASLYIVRGLGPALRFRLIVPLRWLYRRGRAMVLRLRQKKR